MSRWRHWALALLTAHALAPAGGGTPRLLGEAIVSTDLNEFGGTLTPDGRELYFSVSVPRSYMYAVCVSRLRGGRWTGPEIVPFSGIAKDFDPVLSPDGRRLFFVSDRGEDGVTADRPNVDLWETDRTSLGAWGRPKRLPSPINSAALELFASVAKDGTLYYASQRPNGVDILRAPRADSGYAEPRPIGAPIDTAGLEGEPMIAPDQRFLLFSAYERAGGFGDWDIYISHRTRTGWTEPRNLGEAVNTSARDYSPRLGADGHTLIFTSERHFANAPRVLPFSYAELIAALRGILNGNGNLYTVDLRTLGALAAADD